MRNFQVLSSTVCLCLILFLFFFCLEAYLPTVSKVQSSRTKIGFALKMKLVPNSYVISTVKKSVEIYFTLLWCSSTYTHFIINNQEYGCGLYQYLHTQ